MTDVLGGIGVADRAKNHHKRKNTFKIIRAVVIVLVIAVICILGFKSDFVQGRLASSFGNNAEIQKREYNKQREIAKKKYGEYKEPKGDSKKVSSSLKKTSSVVSSSSAASSSSESSVSSSSHRRLRKTRVSILHIRSNQGTIYRRLQASTELRRRN